MYVCEGKGDPEGDSTKTDKAKGRDDSYTAEVGSLALCALDVHVWCTYVACASGVCKGIKSDAHSCH